MKYAINVCLLLLLHSGLMAQEIWSLTKCLEHAEANNIRIKQGELNVEMNKAAHLQSKLGLAPTINGSASHSYFLGKVVDPTTNDFTTETIQTNNFGLSSGAVLFNGFRKINTVKQSKYDILASQADVEKIRNDISLNIVSNYLQILYNKEVVKLSREQLQVSQLQLSRIQKFVRAGSLPEGDLLEIEADVESRKLDLITSQNLLEISLLDLKLLLVLEPATNLEIETPNLSIDPALLQLTQDAAAIYGAAEKSMPEIRSANENLNSAQRGLAIARAGHSATLSIGGNMGTNFSDAALEGLDLISTTSVIGTDISGNNVISLPFFTPTSVQPVSFSDQIDQNFNQSVGFSLSIPIFNGWLAHTNVSLAKIGVMNAEYNVINAKNQLQKEVYTAHQDANAAAQKHEAARKSSEALTKAFEYVEKKFQQGLISFFELSTAKNNMSKAQADLLQAKYDYTFKVKILDFYQGKPITL